MPDYLVWHKHGEQAHHRISEPAQQNRDGMMDMLNDLAMGFEFDPEEDNQPPPEVQELYRLLEAGDEKLHSGTEKTVLDTLSRLLAIKSDHNIRTVASMTWSNWCLRLSHLIIGCRKTYIS